MIKKNSNFKIILSKSTLDKADMCARELWRSKKYNKKKNPTSDDELIGLLSKPINNYLKGKTLRVNLSPKNIELLINASQMTRISSVKNVSIRKGIFILPNLLNQYRQNIKNIAIDNSNFYYPARDMVIDLGEHFYKKRKNIGINGGCHAALSTRFLFFASPTLPIFNYSSKIASSFKLNGKVANRIPSYYEIIASIYLRNWKNLKNYQMPLSNHIDDDYWLLIKENGWWQRRVLDIALLLHFKIFTEKQFNNDAIKVNIKKYI